MIGKQAFARIGKRITMRKTALFSMTGAEAADGVGSPKMWEFDRQWAAEAK